MTTDSTPNAGPSPNPGPEPKPAEVAFAPRPVEGSICANCRSWFKVSGEPGECRRYAPRLTVLAEISLQLDLTFWPRVRASDWCSEHEPIQPVATTDDLSLRVAIAPFLAVADALSDFAEVDEDDQFILDVVGPDDKPLGLTPGDFRMLAAAFEGRS